MKAVRGIVCAVLLLLLLGAGALGLRYFLTERRYASGPSPQETATAFLDAVCASDFDRAGELLGAGVDFAPSLEPESELGKLIYETAHAAASYELVGDDSRSGALAAQKIEVSALDLFRLTDGIGAQMQELITDWLAEAEDSFAIYDSELNFRSDVTERAYSELVRQRLSHAEDYLASVSAEMELRFDGERWTVTGSDELLELLVRTGSGMVLDIDAYLEQSRAEAVGELSYVRKHYAVPAGMKAPEPDQSCYGETDDPAVVTALVNTPLAKQLIGDQTLVWNEEIERIPGSLIHYYLDETILTIVWQEETAKAAGTYAEVFLADASQLGRKLAGDEFNSGKLQAASVLASEVNAVLATGGDYYSNPTRRNGICVYEGEICRYEPDTSDSCYFTRSGDMIFSYRGELATREEAEAFVKENDVWFSVCFGPVLIDGGEDVMPLHYPWGEIYDRYARAAIGQMGELHYLAMTVNSQRPGYYHLVTLREAANAMLAHGCPKAYTLDGGQTACIILNNEPMNTIQFGRERETSDIIYFATAMGQAGEP